MLRVIEGLPAGAIGVEAVGKVSSEDYHEVVEPAVAEASKATGKVRILMVFGDEFDGFDAGGAWEDMKVGFGNWSAWERIAVVTSHTVMRDAIRAFGWMSPGDVRVFDPAGRADAEAWLAG